MKLSQIGFTLSEKQNNRLYLIADVTERRFFCRIICFVHFGNFRLNYESSNVTCMQNQSKVASKCQTIQKFSRVRGAVRLKLE